MTVANGVRFVVIVGIFWLKITLFIVMVALGKRSRRVGNGDREA